MSITNICRGFQWKSCPHLQSDDHHFCFGSKREFWLGQEREVSRSLMNQPDRLCQLCSQTVRNFAPFPLIRRRHVPAGQQPRQKSDFISPACEKCWVSDEIHTCLVSQMWMDTHFFQRWWSPNLFSDKKKRCQFLCSTHTLCLSTTERQWYQPSPLFLSWRITCSKWKYLLLLCTPPLSPSRSHHVTLALPLALTEKHCALISLLVTKVTFPERTSPGEKAPRSFAFS